MTIHYKRVPAVDKCFAILELFSRSREPLGISDLSRQLDLHKSTVFNTVHTLVDLGVLEKYASGKFHLGTRLYLLGNAAGQKSELIHTIRPFLARINSDTNLSAFLGIRSQLQAIIVDKVDTASDIRISSEVGMQLPLTAGAGGLALMSQLPDQEITRVLKQQKLHQFTERTCIDRTEYKKRIRETRESGIAFDNEEYIGGIVAFAVPIKTHRPELQTAIWAVGLRAQVDAEQTEAIAKQLKQIAVEVTQRFSLAN